MEVHQRCGICVTKTYLSMVCLLILSFLLTINRPCKALEFAVAPPEGSNTFSIRDDGKYSTYRFVKMLDDYIFFPLNNCPRYIAENGIIANSLDNIWSGCIILYRVDSSHDAI